MLRGFTLIELLVVIVVIGILSTIGVATFNTYFEKARHTKRLAHINQISSGIRQYFALEGENLPLPASGACIGLNDGENCWGDRLGEGNTALNNALRPYVKITAQDPEATNDWGDNYYLFQGQLSIGCRPVIPSDPSGLWVIWRHPETNGGNCKNGGMNSCCSGTPFCGNAGGYFCAYSVKRDG